MHDLINFTGYRSILCLNGDLPKSSFFTQRNLPIIAADGAANSLLAQDITPSLIIGDLDSVDDEILKQHPFIHSADQSTNDYQKVLGYLAEQNLLPAIVVGINGGHLDHILNNINIFMESNCLLYAPPIKGFVLKEQMPMNITLPLHSKISLIGIPQARLSSQGLKWELNNAQLSFPGTNSCFNRVQQTELHLEVHQGAVLVLIYEQMVHDAGSS